MSRRYGTVAGFLACSIGTIVFFPGCGTSLPDPPVEAEMAAVKEYLGDVARRFDQVLSSPPDSRTNIEDLVHAVGMVYGIAREIADLDTRAARAMDGAVEACLQHDTAIKPVADALDEVGDVAEDIKAAADRFLDSGSADIAPPEFRRAVQSLRDRLLDALFTVRMRYYKRFIPIRFVQLIDDPHHSQVLSDAILQHNIDVANEIFKPARIRFYLRRNVIAYSPEFARIYDENGQHVAYTWPEDISNSPLIWPLDTDQASRDAFQRPLLNAEPRFYAQMRAGTYCGRHDEVLVYINQGKSNGGQYPWFSRIIGMSEYHMHRPGSGHNRYTFAHEMGHYLGLPHPFPSKVHYQFDYDMARIIMNPDDIENPEWRFFGGHDSLMNPETGQVAPLSLFWDLVFRPGCNGAPNLFFSSREEAAQHEAHLQPVEQWNAKVCLPFDSNCADSTSPFTRLEHMVSAGCRGPYGTYTNCSSDYFGSCSVPIHPLYTGDDRTGAISRFGSSIGTLRWNVMSYWYPMAGGSEMPSSTLEGVFLCQSQLEQIDRVFETDIATSRFFPGQYGSRPLLGLTILAAQIE